MSTSSAEGGVRVSSPRLIVCAIVWVRRAGRERTAVDTPAAPYGTEPVKFPDETASEVAKLRPWGDSGASYGTARPDRRRRSG